MRMEELRRERAHVTAEKVGRSPIAAPFHAASGETEYQGRRPLPRAIRRKLYG
jgi:hypothetical protein